MHPVYISYIHKHISQREIKLTKIYQNWKYAKLGKHRYIFLEVREETASFRYALLHVEGKDVYYVKVSTGDATGTPRLP